MRRLFVLALLVCGIAQAQVALSQTVYYAEVVGLGTTPELARTDGFRLAIEKAIGSIVSSETEAQNGRLVRDEIINYSAGYVDRFEIVSVQPYDQGTKVAMKVWVKRSDLANRLLNQSKIAGEVDGTTAAVSFGTAVHERITGDRLLQSVLNDYPRRAFEVQIGKTQVSFTGQRTAQLQVPIQVNFSKHYLDSLWAALAATQNSGGRQAEITVKTTPFSPGGTATYTDDVKYRLLSTAMIAAKPMISVKLLNEQNQVVYTTTYNMPALTHDGAYSGTPVFASVGNRIQRWGAVGMAPYQMVIDGTLKVPATVVLDVDPMLLAQTNRVAVEILR